MELQFHGANCLTVSFKSTRIVIDDNLKEVGKKSIIKSTDVSIFTNENFNPQKNDSRLTINGPGEYEIGEISVVGIPATPYMNDDSSQKVTMYKLSTLDMSILICGHILDELNENQLELIGNVDVMVVPVGNNGYTLDPIGVLKLIKNIEPNIVIPTHYKSSTVKYPVEQIKLEDAIKDLAMEPKEKVAKLKLKPTDLSEITQLIILEEA